MRAELQKRLREIEQAIADGSYKAGRWQRLIGELEQRRVDERLAIAADVSRVSRALHRRNGFKEIPFAAGYLMEWVLLGVAVLLLEQNNLLAVLGGSVALALCLQPLIKITTGLTLGVRYDYTFLWYIEPRFKMRFGTYLALEPINKVLLHLSGGIGTWVALLIAGVALYPLVDWLGMLALAGALFALLLQVGAFAAEWLGVRRVGPFRLSLLTSPATAAMELRKMVSR